MKLNLQDLPVHLTKKLAPVYIVAGDEPLQVGESCDAIRNAAKRNQFTERRVLNVDKGFDWGNFFAVSNSMSLFAERQLIELRMPGNKPGDKGNTALTEYVANPPADSMLLIVCGKLDKQAQRSEWFQRCETAGVYLAIWPVDVQHLPAWIQQRARSKSLQLSKTAVQYIVDRVEGNMLAAAQELDKLHMLYGGTPIDDEAVLAAVSDNARYDIYSLVDVALTGELPRTLRMLEGLRAEGVDPVLLNWALAREIRTLLPLADAVARGRRVEQVVAQSHVWPKRKPMVSMGLKRHTVQSLQALLGQAAKIDHIIKGLASGEVWDELLQLSFGLSGVPLFATSRYN